MPSVCLALPSDSDTQLQQILDTLTDRTPSSYRGYTQVLSGVSESMSNETDIGPYWTGSEIYKGTLGRIQLVQLIHDTLLAFPHLEFSSSVPGQAQIELAFTKAASAININANTALTQSAYSIIQDIKSTSEIAEAYFYLHTLQEKTSNCLNYWEDNDESQKANVIIERNSNTAAIPTIPSDCQKVFCSTDTLLPYNGFSEISLQGYTTHQRLLNINCSDQSILTGTHAGGKTQLCRLVSGLIRKDTSIRSAPRMQYGNAALPLSVGKNYLINLIENSQEIQNILKAILILQIDEKITDPRSKMESLPSLYQPPKDPAPTTCNISNTTALPGPNNTSCTPSEPYTPDEPTTLYISQVLGLSEAGSVIATGIPQGLPESTILISGKYLNFTPISTTSTLLRATDTFQSSRGPSVRLALFMDQLELSKIRSYRNLAQVNFYTTRTKQQNEAINILINKASSIDIITDIRTQNERVIAYQNTANQFRSKQLTLLKDTAAWRIKNNAWLDSVSVISNDSLLREIAILLAEIKHIQYHKFANTQKSLLMTAIITSKSGTTNFRPLMESMARDLKDSATGGTGNDPMSPPNSAAQRRAISGSLGSITSNIQAP